MRWMVVLVAVGCSGPAKQHVSEPVAEEVEPEEELPGPLLWKVTTKSGKVSYLFADELVHPDELSDLVWEALEESTHFVSTYDPAKLSRDGLWPERVERAGLNEDDWRKLAFALPHGPLANLEQIKPWLLHEMLSWSSWVVLAGTFTDDKIAGKEREFLLSAEEEEADWEGTFPTQDDLVERLGRFEEDREQHARYMRAYRKGELAGALRSPLVPQTDRDRYRTVSKRLAERLSPLVRRGGAFYEASVFQLALDGGIIDRLRAEGHTIERVGAGTPATKPFPFPELNRAQECIDAMVALVFRSGEFAEMTGDQHDKLRPAMRDGLIIGSGRPHLSRCVQLTTAFLDCVGDMQEDDDEEMDRCVAKGMPQTP